MTVIEQDPRTIPGALETYKTRALADGAVIEFEEAPAGWLLSSGEVRLKDWRAYYWTPPPSSCDTCDGSGRVAGKTAKGKQCPDCKGTGDPARRTRKTSATTALDAVIGKPGLPPWYEARGILAGVEAVRLGYIDPHDDASASMAVEIVREYRIGAEKARDEAAARGLNVHACLEHYMLTGSPPNPADHPPEHWGYLRALTRWLLKARPVPVMVEEIVCHPEDGYAGRLDLRADMYGALYTVDAKTSEKGAIYLGAHAQLALYERAAVRCGDPAADRRLVVVFAADGEFREMASDHSDSFTQAALDWIREARPVDAACERANRAEREARKAA